MKLVLTLLLLLLIPFSLAAAPSISTLTPSNNSVYPSSDLVVGSVVASDADSDPINYTWRHIPSVIMINDSWRFSGCGVDSAPVNGSNFSVKNRIRAEDAGCTAVAEANFLISTDNLVLEYDVDETASAATATMYIGGDSVITGGAQALQNHSINTTKYNNGSSIAIRFEVSGSVAFNDYTVFWWFPQYKEGSTSFDGSGDTLVQSIVVQNSSSSSHTFNRYEMRNYVSPWKWGVTACDNTSNCTSSNNFTITFSEFGPCSNPLFREAFNITVVDENNNNSLVSAVDLVLNVSDADSSNKEVFNYVVSETGQTSYTYCSHPNFISHDLNNFLAYLPDNSDYTNNRFYYFTDTPINPLAPLKLLLYALNDTLATSVVVTVKQSAVPVENSLVQLNRFDTSTGTSQLVGMCETSSEGKCTLLAQLNDALYSFNIISGGETALSTGFSQITSSAVTLNLPESSDDPSSGFRSVLGVTYDLTYNNDTGFFTCTFSDGASQTLTTTLLVEQVTPRATTTINSSSVSSASGSLTIHVPQVNGTTYKGTCSAVFPSGLDAVLNTLIITIPRGEQIWGSMGWFLFTLTAIVFSLIFINNPMAALILNGLNLIVHKLIGTIPLDWTVVIGFVTVIMIIAIYTRLDRR